MTVRGLVRLLQILGGKVAAEFRKEVEEIFTRYTAGDVSMVEEVMANAGSAAPLNAVFRNALASEPVQLSIPDGPASLPEQGMGQGVAGGMAEGAAVGADGGLGGDPMDNVVAKRQRDRDDALMELEIQERRMALELKRYEIDERRRNMDQSHKALALDNVKKGFDIVRSIYPAGPIDERFALQMEDLVKNILLPTGLPLQARLQVAGGDELASGGGGSAISSQSHVNPTQSISVSVVMASMGYVTHTQAQAQAVGRRTAAKYRARYGTEPMKHPQALKGNTVFVNSYMEKDRDLMEEAVREVMEG